MWSALFLVTTLLATTINGSGEGNIHLLEEDIAAALRICATTEKREKREDVHSDSSNSRIDIGGISPPTIDGEYDHVRRNTTLENSMNMLNDSGVFDGAVGKNGDSQNTTARSGGRAMTKRSDPLNSKTGEDECLSQCVFANMQVVDPRGIPREAELWYKVQTAVTSQQSRSALRNQLRACFEELESEAEDDGCSYSNKLERCLTLHLSDRRLNTTDTNSQTQQ